VTWSVLQRQEHGLGEVWEQGVGGGGGYLDFSGITKQEVEIEFCNKIQ
jgi:hypothetical protein